MVYFVFEPNPMRYLSRVAQRLPKIRLIATRRTDQTVCRLKVECNVRRQNKVKVYNWTPAQLIFTLHSAKAGLVGETLRPSVKANSFLAAGISMDGKLTV